MFRVNNIHTWFGGDGKNKKNMMASSCFIIKKPFNGYVYTIRKNDRSAIIAFTDKKQAQTYKRLMNEMTGHTSLKWTNNKLQIEQINTESIIKMSNLSGLDCIVYDKHASYLIYEADNVVSDDVIFNLEMKFRYY